MTGNATPERAAIAPYVPTDWSSVANSLDRWKQGDLVGPVPWGWIAPSGIDVVTNVEVDADDDSEMTIALAAPDRLAIVTSQTCDVVSTGPGARHPFVQVSPVVEATGIEPNRLAALRQGEIVDLVLLDRPENGVWVADLRVSVPLSKAILSAFTPQPGFRSERGRLDFAAHLAAKVGRPALHDFVSDTARKIIQQAIKEAKADTDWWTEVDEVRVRCTPTRLHPTALEYLVVAREEKLPPADRNRWKVAIDRVRKAAKPLGIKVMHPIHKERMTLLANDYRSSTQVHLDGIRRVSEIH